MLIAPRPKESNCHDGYGAPIQIIRAIKNVGSKILSSGHEAFSDERAKLNGGAQRIRFRVREKIDLDQPFFPVSPNGKHLMGVSEGLFRRRSVVGADPSPRLHSRTSGPAWIVIKDGR